MDSIGGISYYLDKIFDANKCVVMATQRSRCGQYIFVVFLLSFFFLA